MSSTSRNLPISPIEFNLNDCLLRVKSAQAGVRVSQTKKFWQPEEYRLVSPKSPDPSIAKTLYRQLSIQRSEDTLMRTSKRLEYYDPLSKIDDIELRDSITIFSPFNGPKKVNMSSFLNKSKKPDPSVILHKPVLSPRKLSKNMKLGINKKLERNCQKLAYGCDLQVQDKHSRFPANGLVHVPKDENRKTNNNEKMTKQEELFKFIYTISSENQNIPKPWCEKQSSHKRSSFQNSSPHKRPHTTQDIRRVETYANMQSSIGSYIRENDEIEPMPNVHSFNRKTASPPHVKREDVEDDFRRELFEKPFLSDKATVRNRYKIPRLLINRKCSGRKLVSEFMDLKSLKSVKDALVECREKNKKKVINTTS
jgi:hypothetical protein